jgi:simple sugar transport system ATP-binding protein
MDAINNKIAFCPEDRKRDGIIGDLTIRENIALALQARRGMMKPMSRKEQDELADKYIKMLAIPTPDAEKKIKELSGGNQQKVILARWMATEPDLLILDEPTRGIDVGAKSEIYLLINQLVKSGKSVIMISSELPEIVGMSDRVMIMHEGHKVGELSREEVSPEAIMALCV